MGNIQAYIDACQAITSENAPTGERTLTTVYEVTQVTMPETYKVPAGNFLPNTGAFSSEHSRGIWHELVQHLHDLRYLTEAEFKSYHENKKRILQEKSLLYPVLFAVREYLREERWEESEPPGKEGDIISLGWLNRHLIEVTESLSVYTSWDGRLPTPKLFSFEEPGCYQRSLAYRLRMLTTDDFALPEEDLFSRSSMPRLRTFFLEVLQVKRVGFKKNFTVPPAKVWQVLGNVDLLLKQFDKSGLFPGLDPIWYQLPDAEKGKSSVAEIQTLFEKADVKLFKALKAGTRLLKKAIKLEVSKANLLQFRLLQLKLWQTNYYVGAIDGEWGQMSHDALRSFLAEEMANVKFKSNQKRVRAQKNIVSLLLPVNRKANVYILNFRGVYARLKKIKVVSTTDLEEDSKKLFARLTKRGVSPAELDRSVLSEQGVSGSYASIEENTARRVAVTRERFIPSLLKGLGRIINWIKRGVANTVKKIVGLIFGFVKLLLRKVRMAISHYLKGFRYLTYFLFGKPLRTLIPAEGNHPAMVFATKFQLDFDAATIVPAQYKQGDANAHSTNIRKMLEGMGYFIDQTIYLIKAIGKLSNPGGWVWLGWQIGRAVFRLIREGPELAT